MRPEEIQAQREMDEDILAYVRGMQSRAPVMAVAIGAFLSRVRRRQFTPQDLDDRLADLVDRELLHGLDMFQAGQGHLLRYEVTSAARQMLDGAAPWDWEVHHG